MKPMRRTRAARGASKAPRVRTQASSGRVSVVVAVSLPPMVQPHKPEFTEQVVVLATTAKPRSHRNAVSSSRLGARSRMGAMTGSSGAMARSATSKRTWSLPAAVQPWALAAAPRCRATRAVSAACRVRSAPTLRG